MKIKFTCLMFQAHMRIPTREVPKGNEDGYGSSYDPALKATTTQTKINK